MLYPDSQTNKVYFSNLLKNNYKKFSKKLFKILDKHSIRYELISNTKDIWMRDYMPIQKIDDRHIRYIHQPDYLVNYSNLRSNPKEATSFLESHLIQDIKLNLDGGNIVRTQNKIISTDKIFKENIKFSKEEVIEVLTSSLDIKEVIIIPEQPFDMTGHSDGLVRFIDESKVMISPYMKDDSKFEEKLIRALLKHNLEILTLPAKGYYKEKDGAVWIPYINYMQVGNLIILPSATNKVDAETAEFFKVHFPSCTIEWIDAHEIIKEGGALNCISWNIYDGNLDDK